MQVYLILLTKNVKEKNISINPQRFVIFSYFQKENSNNINVPSTLTMASFTKTPKATCYPNPSKDNFTLAFDTTSNATLRVDVYDIVGKRIETHIIKTQDQKNIQIGASYAAGIYTVVVMQNTEKSVTRISKQ